MLDNSNIHEFIILKNDNSFNFIGKVISVSILFSNDV